MHDKKPPIPGMDEMPPLPYYDPSRNVLGLVEAAVRRLDDLSALTTRHLNEMHAADVRRIDEIAALRADYDQRLRDAEAGRLDAIRRVDVERVTVDRERAAAQADVLAQQVAASAEALRSLVAQTATTIAAQLTQTTAQLTDRLSALEKSQYEQKGRGIGVRELIAGLAVAATIVISVVALLMKLG
jgi:hypothetical protein